MTRSCSVSQSISRERRTLFHKLCNRSKTKNYVWAMHRLVQLSVQDWHAGSHKVYNFHRHTALIGHRALHRRVDLTGYRSHRRIGLTGVQLSQVCSSHRYAALRGIQLSQACKSHRCAALTGMQLSQVCSSHRYTALTGV